MIPALTGKHEVSEDEQFLFSLPVVDGGLNIILPEDRLQEIDWSREMSATKCCNKTNWNRGSHPNEAKNNVFQG